MAINVTEEGDDLTAASVDDRLTEVADEYNSLNQDALTRRRLYAEHLPAAVDFFTLFTNGYTGGSAAAATDERYDNTLPVGQDNPGVGPGTGGVHSYLELFAPSGPFGSYTRAPGGIAEEGWLIPRSLGSPATEGMFVELAQATDLTTQQMVGIKATAWINLKAAGPGTDPNAVTQDPNAQTANYDTFCMYLGIGVEDSDGNRRVINRSIRRVNGRQAAFGPISTMTVIVPSDLSQGSLTGNVKSIFGAVLSALCHADVNQHGSIEPEIKEFNITVEPIRAGVLE
jgi:hypothetical protein